jgi:hypothetical protein
MIRTNNEKIEAPVKILNTTAKISGGGSEISYFDRNAVSVTRASREKSL